MTFLLGTQNIQLFLKQMGDGAVWKKLRYDTWEAALDTERVKLGGENLSVIGVLRSFLRVTNGTLHPKMCSGKDKSKTIELSFSRQLEAVQPGVPEHISC